MGNNSSRASKRGKKGAAFLQSNMDQSQRNVRSHSPSEDESGWILECMVEFVRSPECSIFVDGFIDENCLVFDANSAAEADEAVQREWRQTHARYTQMVEALLLSSLAKLGLSRAQFTDAMHKAQSAEPRALDQGILRFIVAIDDFAVFRSIMVQRNVDLEKEALRYLQQSQPPQQPHAQPKAQQQQQQQLVAMSEEEQLAWAMKDSLALQQSKPTQPEPVAERPLVEIAPSAPTLSAEPSKPSEPEQAKAEKKAKAESASEDAAADPFEFDLLTAATLPSSKKISLKPLKLQKRGKASVAIGDIASEEAQAVLPRLTAESIESIKLKQSSQTSAASMLEQKRMILRLRKQRRTQDMQAMRIEPSQARGWNVDPKQLSERKSTNPSTLPPLHKSLFAKMGKGKGDAPHTLQ